MLPRQPPQTYNSGRPAPVLRQDIFTAMPPRPTRHWGSPDNNVNRLGAVPAYRSANSPYPHPGYANRPRSRSLVVPPPLEPVSPIRSRSLTVEEGGIAPLGPSSSRGSFMNTISKYIRSDPLSPTQEEPDVQEPPVNDSESVSPKSRPKLRTRANSDPSISSRRPPMSRRDTGVSEAATTWADDSETDVEGEQESNEEKKFVYDKAGNRIAPDGALFRTNHSPPLQSIRFITAFARALLQFGAPTHRSESLLNSVSRELGVNAHFVQFPGIIVASFSQSGKSGKGKDNDMVRFIKSSGGLDLGRLHRTHCVYRDVMHDNISAREGAKRIDRLLKEGPIYGSRIRGFFAFGCAAAICPLAFGGSFADMWVAGSLSCLMMVINNKYAVTNPIMANIFELVMAVVISLVARALSFVNNEQLFCYQAITSGGVVLILPGFLILLSSLDLANKHMLTGSIRLVYTITYTLFLAFCLTLGSDIFFIIDPSARHMQEQNTASLGATTTVNGTFAAISPAPSSNISAAMYNSFNGSFTFANSTAVSSFDSKVINGCYRDSSWGWYAQALPPWSLFILVPCFSVLISLNNMQPIMSWHFPAMVIISICSFAANKFANVYAFSHSSIITTVGAFVVGICGNLYSRFFRGSGFTVTVTGVLFLVPSGLSDAGGLANNRGTDNDYFAASLQVASRMIQVGIGITLGLLFSGLLVYLFGKKKKTAVFNF